MSTTGLMAELTLEPTAYQGQFQVVDDNGQVLAESNCMTAYSRNEQGRYRIYWKLDGLTNPNLERFSIRGYVPDRNWRFVLSGCRPDGTADELRQATEG